jgi:hypothetical protein
MSLGTCTLYQLYKWKYSHNHWSTFLYFDLVAFPVCNHVKHCPYPEKIGRGGKNRRAREHRSQEMLNSCRKFVWMKICYWKFEGNLNPLWAQQHMVDRRYSLNLKPWSARTLYVYAHADLAQKYSVSLRDIFVSRLCSQGENYFFLPWRLVNKY